MNKAELKPFDFSCKHDYWIHNPDGSFQRMDEPFFESDLIAPDTWIIRSDGDFSYLLAGSREAMLIDSGYGCGNIREYCQTLTDKPVRNIANTHDHFDHTANNGRFEKAYMSPETYPLATVPFPSFEGIYFPKDYEVELISDGYVIDLGDRTLEVLEVPNHAVGSLIFLDRKTRILFSGDEFMAIGLQINTTVEHWMKCLDKMKVWDGCYDCLYGGNGWLDVKVIDYMRRGCQRILDGEEGQVNDLVRPPRQLVPDPEHQGRIIVERYLPRPCDSKPKPVPESSRILYVDDYPITYNKDKIFDE